MTEILGFLKDKHDFIHHSNQKNYARANAYNKFNILVRVVLSKKV